MQTIDNYNFKNKKALIRVDFNVPLNEKFEITDDTRMRAAIPTIKKVLAGGGSVILMSHLGRPKNGPEDKFSLKHIQKHLEELLGVPVKFADNCIGESAIKAAADRVLCKIDRNRAVSFFYIDNFHFIVPVHRHIPKIQRLIRWLLS